MNSEEGKYLLWFYSDHLAFSGVVENQNLSEDCRRISVGRRARSRASTISTIVDG